MPRNGQKLKPKTPPAKGGQNTGQTTKDKPTIADTPKSRDRSQSVKRKEISPSKIEEQPSQKNPRTDDAIAGNSDENHSTDVEDTMDVSDSFRIMHDDIEGMIKKYLAKATKAIMDTLNKHSQTLQEIFMQNADTAIQLDDVRLRIESNEEDVKSVEKRCNQLEGSMGSVLARIQQLESESRRLQRENEELQQYGRRNALRFNNVPIGEIREIPHSYGRMDTDGYIMNLINNVLQIPLPVESISRSHIVGQVNKKYNTCQIIVKFVRYNSRQRVYAAKSKLKGYKHKIFIAEDLTRTRFSVVGKLNKLRSEKNIDSFWTLDGRVFFRISEKSPKRQITEFNFEDSDDLLAYIKSLEPVGESE